jgi:hypothetical protein
MADESDRSDPGRESAEAGKRNRLVTGFAFGIGSAAVVAALLYANRGKSSKPKPKSRT